MSIQIQAIQRFFIYNGMSFPDPGPAFTPDDVKQSYSAAYPELATAAIETEVGETSITYKFVRAVGVKG